MEVTSENFQEVLVELDDVLKDATFLAIDGEFTGLNTGPDIGIYDTPTQYYLKLREKSMDFLLVQFGLSVFTFNSETQKYSQRSYNFYVFPRPVSRAAPDCRFMCQSSSISFLANQGFDFNKLFRLGIPYLTAEEERLMVKRLSERRKIRDDDEILPIPETDRPQIEDICRRINEFINSDAKEVLIDKCNAFIRRLVYQEVKRRWPNKLRVENKIDNFGCVLVVQRVGTKEEEKQREAERVEKELLELQQASGLNALMQKIVKNRKLIVGHNMLLDLCHIFHQFFDELPKKYEDFKSLLNHLFPRILDTKLICNAEQLKESIPSSNLNLLLKTVSKPPFEIPEVEPVDGRSYSTFTKKCHEAGYDAYITGICFIALSNYLGSLQDPKVSIVLPDSPLLEPFLNKLNIGVLKDVPYIKLDGEDPNPSRDHVFHLTFPKEWKFSNISHLFSVFGSVHVSWLSDTSAYVALNRRDQASKVLELLGRTGKHFRMQTYVEHQLAMSLQKRFWLDDTKKESESIAALKGGYSVATNVDKTGQNDDGWEVAIGNDHELSSEPIIIIPSPYPRERSRATLRPRGTNHEASETHLDRSNVAQKSRSKNNLMSPSGRKRNVETSQSHVANDSSRSVKFDGRSVREESRAFAKRKEGESLAASSVSLRKTNRPPSSRTKSTADKKCHSSRSSDRKKNSATCSSESTDDELVERPNAKISRSLSIAFHFILLMFVDFMRGVLIYVFSRRV